MLYEVITIVDVMDFAAGASPFRRPWPGQHELAAMSLQRNPPVVGYHPLRVRGLPADADSFRRITSYNVCYTKLLR